MWTLLVCVVWSVDLCFNLILVWFGFAFVLAVFGGFLVDFVVLPNTCWFYVSV